MSDLGWPRRLPDQIERLEREPVDGETLARAAEIVEQVRRGGEPALRELAVRFGDVGADEPLLVSRHDLDQAVAGLPGGERALLERTAARIAAFAERQRQAIQEVTMSAPGGEMGHSVAAVERAGCYAPGGRYPLPSSVLMTAVTARVAGVAEVWVASPRPAPITLAAAAVAGADGLLAAGGAQAVAALAYGVDGLPSCDVVVGPGNRWVTAAKKLVAGRVGIDMLAGPSELVVLADASADPALVAADLLAQAEHDPDALPVLVSTSSRLVDEVEHALVAQLAELPTRDAAVAALGNGFAVLASSLDEAIGTCNGLAPEHLQVVLADPNQVVPRLVHYGALFLGAAGGEVLGDYGAGPNHTLPTGGGARFSGGLSVQHFLRTRTWVRIDDLAAARELVADAAQLARLEGLEAHARAAERRLG